MSHAFEVHRAGEKHSNFVSVKVILDEPIDVDDLTEVQLPVKLSTGKACIMDALVSGAITQDDATDRVQNLKQNIDAALTAIRQRRTQER